MREIDEVVERSIAKGDSPGAVIHIGNREGVIYEKAYGRRVVVPAPEELTVDTLFDLSSCTKCLATATALMILFDRELLDVNDRVSRYLPSFAVNGKADITLSDLLLHVGGLEREANMRYLADGPVKGFENIYGITPAVPPGSMFAYSDVGYMVIGKVVEAVTGKSLDLFTREEIHEPLGMQNTRFNPPVDLRHRCAPTEWKEGRMLRGEVRDDRARAVGGVAGHAGLFSTAGDVAKFCRMILRKGELNGRRILSESTLATMTTPRKLPGGGSRAYGFDVDTVYGVASRGRRFARGSTFGHTGAAGVSFWIDPPNDCFFVAMAHNVHPDGKGNIREFRQAVSTQIGISLLGERKKASVLCGIDVLRREGHRLLQGKRIGYYTNRPNEPIRELPGFETAVSLKATEPPLVEVVVVDVQDSGARFFSELTVLRRLLAEAAASKIPVLVLDRPNPNSGMLVGGPIAQEPMCRAAHGPIPIVHGLTVGELATMVNEECGIGCSLDVILMEGWQRTMDWDDISLPWENPAADIQSIDAAALFMSIAVLEETNLSLGQGTEHAYQFVGAPWIDSGRLERALSARKLPGVSFSAFAFCPTAGPFAGRECQGVKLKVNDRRAMHPVRTGITIAWELRRLFGDQFEIAAMKARLCSDPSYNALLRAPDPAMLLEFWRLPLQAYRRLRDKYLIYQ